jgi:protein involved in polysaccharide export with SLBB domain
VQQAVSEGKITPQEAQEGLKAIEKGKVSPEMIKQLQERGGLGSLTREEIESGKKLLEQQSEKPAAEPLPKAEEKKSDIKEPKKEPSIPEEEFFKKSAGSKLPMLVVFGHKLFSSAPSTFAPITTVPVSNSYLIGPGDEIKVLMWGRLDASYSLEVDNEGVINFPKVGPLTVAGLTFGEVKELIRTKAEAITGVNINISMGKLRTIQIFVMGEVRSPGVYTVSSLATMVNALLSSGGPTPLGSLRNVQLKRQGKTITSIDLYDFLLKGDTTADMRLTPSDVVFIPQVGPLVAVSGNVRRPAVYEMRGDGTLKGALALAGGLLPQAYNQRIQIERSLENKVQVVLDISFDELNQKSAVPVLDGDLVKVFSIHPTPVNAVYLYGNVLRPGEYAFRKGFKILDVLPDLKSLDKDTYFHYALVKRYRLQDGRSELIPFDLGGLLIRGDSAQNVPLSPLDEIYIFNQDMFKDRAYAVVEGGVRRPGRFLIDDMNVRDLILKAGDLQDDAYLRKGEIIRTDKDRNKHTIYFDVSAAMAGDPQNNLKVKNEDRLIIHSVWEEKWREFATIRGEVKNPGQYPLTKGMRLKDLFFKAGNFTRDTYPELGHLYRTDWRTKETTIHTFNVAKAVEGDPEQNLPLQDLDEVVIHSAWEYVQKYHVSIQGMVNNAGDYPYAENMTIKDLILVAGNVKRAAFLERGELIRYDIVDGERVQTLLLDFDVRRVMAGDPADNLRLKPLDVVTIKEIPEWGERKSATITGEVLFPGTYQIRKEERLSSVITRAGGFTQDAYLRGAVFARESVQKVQQARLQDMINRMEVEVAQYGSAEAQAALSKEDVAAQAQFLAAQRSLIQKLRESKATGRVVISLLPTSVLKSERLGLDLVLESGDRLYVPKSPGTVNVIGSVYNPTALIFEVGRPELNYYVGKTGGPTTEAEEKAMYIVRADGTVISRKASSWSRVGWDNENHRWGFCGGFEDTELHPGDTVVVPQKIVKPSFMKDVKDITQILANIALTAGVIIAAIN